MAIAVILSLILALAGWRYGFTPKKDDGRLQESPLTSEEEEPDTVHMEMENRERSYSQESVGDRYLAKDRKRKPTGRQSYESRNLSHPY